jgi:hypothetical protein
MSNAGRDGPRAGARPRWTRRLAIGGVIALLLAGAVGLGLYWYDWKSARENWQVPTRTEPYLKVHASFLEDIEAGRTDAAYQATTDSFRKRVGRDDFDARAARYRAFKQRAGVAIKESDIAGPVGGDVQRTNQMIATNTWEDAGGEQLQDSVTVVQEADSFFYRRPPPLRVGEFTVGEVTPKGRGKP